MESKLNNKVKLRLYRHQKRIIDLTQRIKDMEAEAKNII